MNELKSTSMQARRAELAADIAATEQDLKAARQQLIDGTAKAKDVTSLQSTLGALQGALSDLDGQIEQQLATEARADAQRHRAQVVSELVEIARQGEQSAAEYIAAYREGFKAIQDAANRLIRAEAAHVALRSHFREISADLLTNSHRADLSWEDEETRDRKANEREQLRADLEAAGVDLSGIGTNKSDYALWCDVRASFPHSSFNQMLSQAVRLVQMEEETARERERGEQRLAAFLADSEPIGDESDTGDPQTPEIDAEGQSLSDETPSTREMVEA